MKAVVKYQPGEGGVQLMDMPEPACPPGHIILEVHACGICGTDLHVYHDTFRNYPPVIMGHEFTGKIVELGKDVKDMRIGDTFAVLGAVAVTCGQCPYCYRGEFMFCKHRRGMGHGVHGAFAPYVCVRPDQCYRLPPGVSMEEGALVEPLAAAVHAVAERAVCRLGDSVLLSGPGPIGMLCLKLLLAQGLKVIVAGTSADKERLEKVRGWGVARTVVVDQEDLSAVVAEETGGAGVDLAFESAGAEGSVRNCLASLGPSGQYVQVGHFGRDLKVPWDHIAFKQLRIEGSVGYTRQTWDKTLNILGQGVIGIADLITHRFPLEQWTTGFELFEKRLAVKVLLFPG